MNNLRLLSPFLFTCLILFSCDNKKAQADYLPFKLNEVFYLPVQGYAKLKGGNLKIQFTEVSEDSRCPEGVTCVWAGQVKVQLAISTGTIGKKLELAKPGHKNGAETAVVGSFEIHLLAVYPYPKAGEKIKAVYYSLELIVRGL